MENIFPFLIGLAVLAFNIYNNFRKEQEKARKRNPSKPKNDLPEEFWKPEAQAKSKPMPDLVEETFDPAHPYEPTYKPVYNEPIIPKVAAEPKYEPVKPESIVREKVNPEVPDAEVQRSRAIHQQHQHKPVLHTEEEAHSYADFDFKDAIIKEAILNRPQH